MKKDGGKSQNIVECNGFDYHVIRISNLNLVIRAVDRQEFYKPEKGPRLAEKCENDKRITCNFKQQI